MWCPRVFVAGTCPLTEIDLARSGDVRDRSLLAWARRGARVTGLDFSEVATAEARRLAERIRAKADFVQSNVLDAPRAVRAAAECLAPNGVLHVNEFHPFCWIWDDAFERVAYAWDGRRTRSSRT